MCEFVRRCAFRVGVASFDRRSMHPANEFLINAAIIQLGSRIQRVSLRTSLYDCSLRLKVKVEEGRFFTSNHSLVNFVRWKNVDYRATIFYCF